MAVGSRNPAVGSGGGGTNNYYTTTEIISGVTMNIVDASAGEVVLTLPSAGANANSTYKIYKADSSANRVIVTGTDPIYGDTILTKQYESLHMTSDSTSWWGVTQQESGVNVRVFGATGNGTDDDRAAVNTAAGIAAGNNLIFPAGTYRLSSNLTLDENLVPHKGAIFSLDSGVVLTISGTITAGRYQIFAGAGTVSFTGNQTTVFPEWWGMFPDDAVDDTTTLQAIITALPNGGVIGFGVGDYELSDIIIIGDDISLIGTPHLSKIHYNASSETWVGTNSTTPANNIYVEGMTFYSGFDGSEYHGTEPPHIYGIRGYFINLTVKNCEFYGLNKDAINGHAGFGVAFGAECNVIIDGNYIHDSAREGIQYRNVSGLRITNNRIENIAGTGINTENDSSDNISRNHVYSHNIVSGGAQGIKAAGIGGGQFEDITITDNIIYDTLYGINCAVDGGIVANNIVHDNSMQGIYMSCKNVVVEGNVCYNNGEYGIWIAGAPANNTVLLNNICYDNQDVPTQAAVYSGASLTGELKHIGNRFHNYTKDSDNVEDTDNVFTSSSIWFARKFTATRSEKITQIRLRLKQLGSGAGTITVTLYSDTPGLPNAVHGTVSDSIAIASISTDGSVLTNLYLPTPPRVASSSVYWIVAKPSGYTYSAGVNELILMTDADGGSSEVAKYDAGWVLTSATDGADFVVEYIADDFYSKQEFSFNTPDINIYTPNNDYRDINFKDGENIHGRIRYFRANADPAADRFRFSVGGQSDVMSLSSAGNLGISGLFSGVSVRLTGSILNVGDANNSIPALGTSGLIAGEIRASENLASTSNYGLLRLSAGGGTDPYKAAIDLQGYGNVDSSQIRFYTASVERMRISNSGNVGIGVTPTAKLHLPAGTAIVNTAPLKLTSGTVLETPEAGAIEFNNDSLYYTKTTGPTRMTIAPLESPSFTTPNIGVATATSVSCSPTISSGAGAPGTTPAKVGDIYVDTTGKKMYAATGITNSTDWTIVN